MTIRGGGAAGSGGAGFVLLDFSVTATATGSNCPCFIDARVRDASTGATSQPAAGNISGATDLFGAGSGGISGSTVMPIGANEQKTFQLQAEIADVTPAATFSGEITALYVPFGSQGGPSL